MTPIDEATLNAHIMCIIMMKTVVLDDGQYAICRVMAVRAFTVCMHVIYIYRFD